tara:strand:+ start:26776 stop:26973 length:198 start_codon:yes stop_codon:yes gene_type:complete
MQGRNWRAQGKAKMINYRLVLLPGRHCDHEEESKTLRFYNPARDTAPEQNIPECPEGGLYFERVK